MQMYLLRLDTAAACGARMIALCCAIGSLQHLSLQFPRQKQALEH